MRETKKVIEDGIEYDVYDMYGLTEYHYNKLYHRVNNPAIEYANGDKEWWIMGDLVYNDFYDNTYRHKLTDIMALQIVKYRLTR